MVPVPRVMVAFTTSTQAPQWISRSRPMMQGSRMLANQNSCTSSWSTAWICSGFFPLMPVFSPVSVISWVLVGDHAVVSGPVVPCRMLGCTREIVDPLSSKARQGWPSSWQTRYSPLVCPRRPTRVHWSCRGAGEWSVGPLTRPFRRRFPPAGWLWPLVLVQDCYGRCDQAYNTGSSSQLA